MKKIFKIERIWYEDYNGSIDVNIVPDEEYFYNKEDSEKCYNDSVLSIREDLQGVILSEVETDLTIEEIIDPYGNDTINESNDLYWEHVKEHKGYQ